MPSPRCRVNDVATATHRTLATSRSEIGQLQMPYKVTIVVSMDETTDADVDRLVAEVRNHGEVCSVETVR